MTTSIVPHSRTIPLTHGYFVIVGWWWHPFLSVWKWHVKKHRHLLYASRTIRVDKRNVTLRMHRFISGIYNPKITIDHVDGNGLNDCEYNMRECTQANNSNNRRNQKEHSSKYHGVSIETSRRILKDGVKKIYRTYKSQITCNYIKHGLGHYPFTEEGEIEAAKAYDAKAKELHGEFAKLNFT